MGLSEIFIQSSLGLSEEVRSKEFSTQHKKFALTKEDNPSK